MLDKSVETYSKFAIKTVFMQLFTKCLVGSNGETWSEQLEKNMPEENKVQIMDWIDKKKYNTNIQQMM